MSIVLEVSGVQYDGWITFNISRDLEKLPSAFTAQIVEGWPSSKGSSVTTEPQQPVRVLVDGQVVLKGYLDEVQIRYNTGEHYWDLGGRSKCQDLVDCSLPGGKIFKNTTFGAIVKEIISPFGVDLELKSPDFNVSSFAVEVGETPFSVIDRLAESQAYYVADTSEGNLIIGELKHFSKSADRVLVVGRDIKSGSARFSVQDRYSDYIVKGQRQATDEDFGIAPATPVGSVKDRVIKRYRPLVITSDLNADAATLATKADLEMKARIGKSTSISYTLPSWTYIDGTLIEPGHQVRVNDEIFNLKDINMVVKAVSYSVSSDGTESVVELRPLESMIRTPKPLDVDERAIDKIKQSKVKNKKDDDDEESGPVSEYWRKALE